MPVYINGVPTETAISLSNGASIDQLQEAFDNLLYRGPHANQAAFPSTGVAGQFLLNLETDSLWVWDVEGNDWVETGVSGGQAGQNVATALQHYYDQVTGTGYGLTMHSQDVGSLLPMVEPSASEGATVTPAQFGSQDYTSPATESC